MTTYVPPKKNTAFILYLSLPSYSNLGAMQSNPTLAAGDAKVSIDGGALANLATLPSVTPASGAMVKVSLSSSEMNGDNITVVLADQTSPKEWCDTTINIQTAVQQIDDLSSQASVNTIDDFLDTEIAAIKAKTDNLPADPADASDIAARFDTVDSALTTIDGNVDAILLDTSEIGAAGAGLTALASAAAVADLPTNAELATALAAADDAVLAAIAALSIPTANENADALLDRANAIETGYTVRNALRIMAAVLAGKVSGAATATNTFRDLADAKDRVTSTVDADGNRTAVTLDGT